MSVTFRCPSCKTTHAASDRLVGRRVRCPRCDELVEVVPLPAAPVAALHEDQGDQKPDGDEGRATMVLSPPQDTGSATVMLEAVDIVALLPKAPPESVGAPPAQPPPRQPRTVEQDEAPDPSFRRTRIGETEMDMTPMVDVTFQMLIFFMITAAFALQKAKEIPKPQPEESSPTVVQQEDEEFDRVTVKIDEYNTFTVINPDGEEDEAPSVQDLYIQLRRAKAGGSSGRTPTKMRVEAHGDALHERVVMALDAGNETGFAELELATTPDDVD